MGKYIMLVLEVEEHKELSDSYTLASVSKDRADGLLLNREEDSDYDKRYFFKPSKEGRYRADLVIGAQWFNEQEKLAVVVHPKMKNIDFLRMFSVCLQSGIELDSFSKIYGIDLDATKIQTKTLSSVITPLIIVHFLGCVQNIVRKGLKKDYIRLENNLKKIKGKINIVQNERKNIIPKRYDRTFCNYQEFSVNTPENRLIKKALVFSKLILQNTSENYSLEAIDVVLKQCLSAFENVDDEIQLYEVKNLKKNKLYKDYDDAIRLAKLILKKYDFSISNISNEKENVAPFWIDMPLLYEHYVLGLLREAYPNEILYQEVAKFKWKPDFLHTGQKLILDTKYMPRLAKENEDMGEIVRQLSGYARIQGIRNKLDVDASTVIKCIAIYPIEAGTNKYENIFLNIDDIVSKSQPISGVLEFYKISVPLPPAPLSQ